MLGNGPPRHHRPCGRTPLQRRPPSRHASFALYEEEPAGPPGKRFVGSSIWRTETVTVGPGHKPDLAIRADVEVPERKLAVTISMRRNTNQALRATHTIEVMFSLPADFPFGGINSVHGVLMKQAAATRGTPLSGSAIRVTPNIFLLGLSMLESDAQRNLELLKERSLVESRSGTATAAAPSSPWRRALPASGRSPMRLRSGSRIRDPDYSGVPRGALALA